jgi:hypothetical protein
VLALFIDFNEDLKMKVSFMKKRKFFLDALFHNYLFILRLFPIKLILLHFQYFLKILNKLKNIWKIFKAKLFLFRDQMTRLNKQLKSFYLKAYQNILFYTLFHSYQFLNFFLKNYSLSNLKISLLYIIFPKPLILYYNEYLGRSSLNYLFFFF